MRNVWQILIQYVPVGRVQAVLPGTDGPACGAAQSWCRPHQPTSSVPVTSPAGQMPLARLSAVSSDVDNDS